MRMIYNQQDRIETKIDLLIDRQELHMNLDENDAILSFLEDEVLSEEGRLTHLKEDKNILAIIEELRNEDSDENEEKVVTRKYENTAYDE